MEAPMLTVAILADDGQGIVMMKRLSVQRSTDCGARRDIQRRAILRVYCFSESLTLEACEDRLTDY